MNNNKNKTTTTIIIIIISFIFAVLLMLSVIFVGFKVIDFSKNNNTKVELKYTETNSKIKEGIYITDVSEVVEEVMPSIVAITSKTLVSSGQFGFNYYGNNRYSEGAGSGIIISKSDNQLMILTNYHVVENASELSVRFINEKISDAKVLGVSERKDVAIITVKLSSLDEDTLNNIKIATLGDSNELKVGNGIIAIGNALGYGQSVTTGVVSALNREVTVDNYTNKMIQLDAAINGGNSGGALINNKGEVVGINSAKYSSNGLTQASIEGMGFAIPISDIRDLITSLMNGEEDEYGATIGINGFIITEDYSEAYNIPTGFYISKIEDSHKSNLEIGWVITKIEGKTVKELTDISDVLANKKRGDKVKLTVKYPSGRTYKEKNVEVTLS